MSATSPRRLRRRIEWTDLDPIGVGAELQNAREMLGLSIEEVAAETKIRLSYLLALEDEHFSRLPTGVAGRGLLRTYATYLGLDAVELLSALEAHGRLSLCPAAVERGARRPAPAHSVLPRLVGLVAAVACVLALAYYIYSQYSAFVTAEASGMPRATISTRGASPTMLPPTPTLPAQATVKQAAALPVVAVPSATPAPRSPTATAGPPLLVPSPTPVPPQPTPVELVVEATVSADTRVSAQIDGQALPEDVISAGDQRTWRGSTITLQVADAGAVEVVVNGRPVGKLGPAGQAKTVTWTR